MSGLVELYRFVEGTKVYTQTRAAYTIVYNSETYDPHPIDRAQIESKNEMSRANLDLRIAIDNPLAVRYLSGPVDFVVTLTIFVQANGTTNTIWRGRLSNVRASGKEVTLTFESIFTSLRRPGLRARYQRSCRHPLYGRGCNLNPETFRVPVMMTGFDGPVINVSGITAEPIDRFRGGMLRGPDGTVRFVVGSSAGQVTLSRTFDSLTVSFGSAGYGMSYGSGGYGGVEVILYPGCAHNPDACKTFNNFDNYGGFPWIPSKNPFGGSSIA